MRSVTLVYLPGANYLIGTFDASRTTGWWVSSGFDGVDIVRKGVQILGPNHIAICKMIDCTWSIFKSENYGQTWSQKLNIAYEIYDTVKILPGRIILNTANGFYETVDSGETWTLVLPLPSAPAASAIANIGNGDILLCTDGRYIWRSTNKARTWTKVCDQRNIGGRRLHKSSNGLDLGFAWIYGSPLTPAIAGANGEVLCAYGPFITMSRDYGLTWDDYIPPSVGWVLLNNWDGYFPENDRSPPTSIIYERFPTTANQPPDFVVKQILVSSVDGPLYTDVNYVVQTDDVSGGYSRVFHGYHGSYYASYHSAYGDDISPTFDYKFRRTVSPNSSNQMDAYELPATVNSIVVDKVVIAAQSKTVDGVLKPTVTVSYDGGRSWSTYDLTLSEFSLPTDNRNIIIDEIYGVATAWTSGTCDNYREVYQSGNPHWRRLQSYDMDWAMQPYETMESPYDMRVKIEPPAIILHEYDMGLYALGRHSVPMLHDSLIEVTNEKSYLNTLIIEHKHSTSHNIDVITEIDRAMPYEMLLWLERTAHEPYVMSYHTEVSSSVSYTMTAWFGQVTVPDIDWASPQWWNLIFPDSNRPPLDSRGVY